MRYGVRLATILAGAALAAPVVSEAADSPAAPAKAAERSVTTTWLPDPFPNLAPRALDRQAIVEVDTPRRTPSVLLGVYDVENDPLSVTSFTQPAHGSAILEKDGTFRYAPQAGYTGRDEFTFTLSDGRGGLSTAAMRISVIRPAGRWSTTSFVGLAEIQADGQPIQLGKGATVPRAVDWDGDGKLDLLVGAGAVWLYRNVGTPYGERIALFNPGQYADRVKVPTLLIDAEKEHYFKIEENSGRLHEILKKNGVPTEYHVLKGIGHYDVYRGQPLDDVMNLEIPWFNKYLKGAK